MGCSGSKSIQTTYFESFKDASDSTHFSKYIFVQQVKTVISDNSIGRVRVKLKLSFLLSTKSLDRELHLTQSLVWHNLREELIKFIFQQDGPPANCPKEAIRMLSMDNFGENWLILRNSHFKWDLYSPNHNPFNFFFRGDT